MVDEVFTAVCSSLVCPLETWRQHGGLGDYFVLQSYSYSANTVFSPVLWQCYVKTVIFLGGHL